MKATTLLTLLGLGAITHIPTTRAEQDDDSIFTLVLLQMITQRNDPGAMQQLYPILLSSIMGDGTGGMDNSVMYYLLLGAGNDPNMHQWLPLILNNKNKDVSDKLLMLLFMQQNAAVGGTGMGNLFPLLLLNANDDKYCEQAGVKCFCKEDNSELLLYIMLLNGNSVGPSTPYSNFMFMLFDNDECDGKLETSQDACKCTGDDEIEGGINAVTYMMMMKMNPQVTNQLPEAPPQRAIDIKDLLKKTNVSKSWTRIRLDV